MSKFCRCRNSDNVPDVYAPWAVLGWLALMLAAIRQGRQFQTDCSVYAMHNMLRIIITHPQQGGRRRCGGGGGAARLQALLLRRHLSRRRPGSSSRLKAVPSAAEGGLFPAETTEPISSCGGSSSSSLAIIGRNLAYQPLGQKHVKNVVAESIVGLAVVQVEIVNCPSTPAELLILDTCTTKNNKSESSA
jgi:hypothetical protein